MATYVGCEAKIVIKENGPTDPPILIGELNSWAINYSFSAEEFRPLGGYYPNRGISAADWSLSISGYFDQLDAGQSLLKAGAIRYFEVYPIGDFAPGSDPIMSGFGYLPALDTSGSPDEQLPISTNITGTSELEAINTFVGNY